MRPLISIVIPAYNREREVGRAIESCLSETEPAFEVVVVDDASTDHTRDRVTSYSNSRVRLVCHDRNRGECPARNTGVQAAQGDWILFLDSDHALVPGAIRRVIRDISTMPGFEGRFAYLYRWDNGWTSPFPIPARQRMNYLEYLAWQERSTLWDMVLCTKKTTFASVAMPDSQIAPLEYHLDFASRFPTEFIPEVLAIQYTDAENRLTGIGVEPRPKAYRRQRAADDMQSVQRILCRHGRAMDGQFPRLKERIWREYILGSLEVAGRLRTVPALFTYLLECRLAFWSLGAVCSALVARPFYAKARDLKRKVTRTA